MIKTTTRNGGYWRELMAQPENKVSSARTHGSAREQGNRLIFLIMLCLLCTWPVVCLLTGKFIVPKVTWNVTNKVDCWSLLERGKNYVHDQKNRQKIRGE